MRTVLEIMEELMPGIEFDNEENLIDDGIIDSFDLVSLIGELNDEYNITIPMWEIISSNFNSVKAIEELIKRQKEARK